MSAMSKALVERVQHSRLDAGLMSACLWDDQPFGGVYGSLRVTQPTMHIGKDAAATIRRSSDCDVIGHGS
jgi:hypothetical protein